VLAAAQIAEEMLAGRPPADKTMFCFAAQLHRANRARDASAVRLAFEMASALLDNAPNGSLWAETRGRLWTLKLAAWLSIQVDGDLGGFLS
jgi:hypothetical protein